MALSSDLISQFVKITKDETSDKKETIVYGTVHKEDPSVFVKIDGSNVYTPVSTTSDTVEGERVIVMIKDHKAVITGNASSPSARSEDVKNLEIVVADKVSTSELEAQNAVIENLKSDNVTITGKLTAAEANIETLQTDKLDASEADIKYATIENLNAANANIENLQTDKLSVSDANIKYATIDFTNIGKAAIEQFFSKSGMISNLVVGESTITGKLVGVTISGDSIEANTIKADKLVVLGSDGLYYKLNVNALGEATASSDEKYQNGLDGSAIIAKTITATQISVHDLVAFGATIGGFHITNNSIYSGVKESAGSTTRGIYFDNDGQFVVGDSSNYIKFFKDTDETYKLDISAKSIKFGSSGKSIEEEVDSLEEAADGNSHSIIDIGSKLEILDRIVTSVVGEDGETRFIQTSDGFKFDLTGTNDKLDEIQTNTGNIRSDLDDAKTSIDGINSSIVELNNSINSIGVYQSYISFGTDSDGKPTIELGKQDSAFRVIITNEAIKFMEGNNMPAYINNQTLFINKASINNELSQGKFVWIARTDSNGNGNYGLTWRG